MIGPRHVLAFVLLAAGCGRTGFEDRASAGFTGDVDGDPDGAIGDIDGDADEVFAPTALCGTLAGFDTPVVLAAPPNNATLSTVELIADGMFTAGTYAIADERVGAIALKYVVATDTWSVLETNDRGAGHVVSGMVAGATASTLYYSTTDYVSGTPDGFVRASFDNGVTWADVSTSGSPGIGADAMTFLGSPMMLGNYVNGTDRSWVASRSNDGGHNWVNNDGPYAGDEAFAFATTSAGLFALGKRVGTQGTVSSWSVRSSVDGVTWVFVGTFFPGGAGNRALTAFSLADSAQVFLVGTSSGNGSELAAQVALLGTGANAAVVDTYSVSGSDVVPAMRTLRHSGGCSLLFENVSSPTASSTRIRGTPDGATFVDLPQRTVAVRSFIDARQLEDGDLLASVILPNGDSAFIRWPVIVR